LVEKAPLRHDGNESLFLAVELSLVSTLAGIPLHVHAEGLRGTGKTTVMRWAKNLSPEIQRIKGCLYHCEPENPHCPLHSGKTFFRPEDCRAQGQDLEGLAPGVEMVPMPFIEIGHGAKLGTILGSIDLRRLTDPEKPEAALLPGSIPMAHRGIVFIDEINRLAETAPEITDVLLSVMGTKPGKVRIEEVGLPPCEIQVSASVWAASNPDEDPGPLEEIRKQLADRFDLVVPVERPRDPLVVEKLLFSKYQDEPGMKPTSEPVGSGPERSFTPASCGPQGLLEKARLLRNVKVPEHILRFIAALYTQRNVESLRAVESLELSARALAALRGKLLVSYEELLTVVPLVLRHRVEPLVLTEILKDLELRKAASVQVTHTSGTKKNPNQERDKKDRDAGMGEGAGPEIQTGEKRGVGRNPSEDTTSNGENTEGLQGREPGESTSPLMRPVSAGDGREKDENACKAKEGSVAARFGQMSFDRDWLQRLFRRCARGFSQWSGRSSRAGPGKPGSGSLSGTERNYHSEHGDPDRNERISGSYSGENTEAYSPPAEVPVSPPDRARRIGYISWEELVLPPDWKGRNTP